MFKTDISKLLTNTNLPMILYIDINSNYVYIRTIELLKPP